MLIVVLWSGQSEQPKASLGCGPPSLAAPEDDGGIAVWNNHVKGCISQTRRYRLCPGRKKKRELAAMSSCYIFDPREGQCGLIREHGLILLVSSSAGERDLGSIFCSLRLESATLLNFY